MELCLVGYTYRNQFMKYAFQKAAQYGYSAIELRDFTDLDLKSIEGVKASLPYADKLSKEFGVRLHSIFKPLEFSSDMRIDKDEWKALLRLLSQYDIKTVNTQIHMPKNSFKNINILGHVDEIASEAYELGIRLCMENHMDTIHESVEEVKSILSVCKRLYLTLDFANFLIINKNVDLMEAIDTFNDKIRYVHCKNIVFTNTGYNWDIPLKDGIISYEKIIKKLGEYYEGALGIEYCGEQMSADIAKMDAHYLKNIISA